MIEISAGPGVAVPADMGHPMKEILIATDFPEGSDEALAAAIDLAKRTGANLHLEHALEHALENGRA